MTTLTVRTHPVRPPARLPAWAGGVGLALVVGAAGLVAVRLMPTLLPAGGLLAFRAAQSTAFAPGADGTLLLAGALSSRLGLDAGSALRTASWAGLILAVLLAGLIGRERPWRSAAGALAAASNPAVLWACAAGYGMAAPGLVLLWSQLLAAPARPPHVAMPLAGLSLAAGAALVPGFAGFALPLFMVLFLSAPRDMARRAMVAVYLIAFLPVAAWQGTLAYARWLTGAAGAGPLPGASLANDPPLMALIVSMGVAAACAPGLVASARQRPVGLGAVAACAFAGLSPGVPIALVALAAGAAQLAGFLRHGGALALTVGLIGATASVWLAALAATP